MNFWRFVIGFMSSLVIFSAAMTLWGAISDREIFPIERVVVVGELDLTQKKSVQQEIIGETQFRSWLTLFSRDVSYRIMEKGWAENVRVEKKWPGILMVFISPQRPYAKWRALEAFSEDDDVMYLNKKGDTLPASIYKMVVDIPLLECDKRQIPDALGLLMVFFDAFSGNLLNLHALMLDRRGNLTVRLNNGEIWRFGSRFNKDAMSERINSYLAFKEKQTSVIKSVDFRYVNGFAIRFEES